jgi:hypothetical protein
MAKFEYAGVMPGSMKVGDIIQNTRAMQKPSRLARSPMGMRKMKMQPDAVRTTVDFRPTPMKTRMR